MRDVALGVGEVPPRAALLAEGGASAGPAAGANVRAPIVLARAPGAVGATAEVAPAEPAPVRRGAEAAQALDAGHVVAAADLGRRRAAARAELRVRRPRGAAAVAADAATAAAAHAALGTAQAHGVGEAARVGRVAVAVVEAEAVVAVAAAHDGLEALVDEGHGVTQDAAAVQVRAARALAILVRLGPLEQREALVALVGLGVAELHHVGVARHAVAAAAAAGAAVVVGMAVVVHAQHVAVDARDAAADAAHGARDVHDALLDARLQPPPQAHAAEVVRGVVAARQRRAQVLVHVA
mmetsp:Transcript_22023/g.67623  ORF Transcript_22023/g.67623 Transcript_22023/m.67623 type:complete len:296 (+) Transcript_22023:978-1865(+)